MVDINSIHEAADGHVIKVEARFAQQGLELGRGEHTITVGVANFEQTLQVGLEFIGGHGGHLRHLTARDLRDENLDAARELVELNHTIPVGVDSHHDTCNGLVVEVEPRLAQQVTKLDGIEDAVTILVTNLKQPDQIVLELGCRH